MPKSKSSTTTNNKKPPPDFRKVKAKVGKRAPKQANLTDTTYTATALSLRHQAVDPTTSTTTGSNEVAETSARMAQFQTQLQHPARPVRLAAAKGLSDLITQHTPHLIPHLPAIVQAFSKCCLDEEDEVRAFGLSILRHLVVQLQSQSFYLVPFASLFMAFVASAMSSLDKGTRRDGAEAVALLGQYTPAVVRPYATTKLLPAFVRLLSDYRVPRVQQQPQQGGKKKRNNKRPRDTKSATSSQASSSSSSSVGILEALRVLLEAVAADTRTDTATSTGNTNANNYQSDPIVWSADSKMALVVAQPASGVRPASSTHLNAPPLSFASLMEQIKQSSSQTPTSNVDSRTIHDLWLKLRDKLLEVSQRAIPFTGDTHRMSWEDLRVTYAVARCFHLCWKSFGRSMAAAVSSSSEQQSLSYSKQWCHQINLWREIFPLYEDGSANSCARDCNLEFCQTILEVRDGGAGIFKERDVAEWMREVASYIHSTLEDYDEDENTHEAIVGLSPMVLVVLRRLLEKGDRQWRQGTAISASRLTELIVKLFFAEPAINERLVNSAAGRSAAQLATAMIVQSQYNVDTLKSNFGPEAASILEKLPLYLIEWKAQHKQDSLSLLQLCLEIVRRISNQKNRFLNNFRVALDSLATNPSNEDNAHSGSKFERLSPQLQRQVVSLVILTGMPSPDMLQGLSRFCARSHLLDSGSSPDVASFVMWSLHSVRKTIPMQLYLSFLIDSSGILDIGSDPWWNDTNPQQVADTARFRAVNRRLSDLMACCLQCGSQKMLPVLDTLLTRLLSTAPETKNHAVGYRAALCVMGGFALDIAASSKPYAVNDFLSQSLCDSLLSTMSLYFRFCLDHKLLTTHDDDNKDQIWTQPLLALLSASKVVFRRFFRDQFEAFTQQTNAEQGSMMQALLSVWEQPVLKEMVQDTGATPMDWLELEQELHPESHLANSKELILTHLKRTGKYADL